MIPDGEEFVFILSYAFLFPFSTFLHGVDWIIVYVFAFYKGTVCPELGTHGFSHGLVCFLVFADLVDTVFCGRIAARRIDGKCAKRSR